MINFSFFLIASETGHEMAFGCGESSKAAIVILNKKKKYMLYDYDCIYSGSHKDPLLGMTLYLRAGFLDGHIWFYWLAT